MRKIKGNLTLLIATIAFTFSLLAVEPAWSHGSITVPSSRIHNCWIENPESPDSDACKEAIRVGGVQAIYSWTNINQLSGGEHQENIPDGELCSAGMELYAGMNLARNDWVSTTIAPDENGFFEFLYRATVSHPTEYHKFYITHEGYNYESPLAWSDLNSEPFCELGDVGISNINGEDFYRLLCEFPQNRTGKHIIYHIWQRADSREAFYACVDVDLGMGNLAPINWKELGNISANENLPEGSKVTFRLFGSDGSDKENYEVILSSENNSITQWPKALAEEVNLRSNRIRIGVLDQSGTIEPIESSMNNNVYINVDEEYSFQVDIEKAEEDTPSLPEIERSQGSGGVFDPFLCLLLIVIYYSTKFKGNILVSDSTRTRKN